MNQYLLAIMVEPLGEDEFAKWPLHITLLPWFIPPKSEDEMIAVLRNFFQFKSSFEAVADEKTHFGRIPIHLIKAFDGRQELVKLHRELLADLQSKEYKVNDINYVDLNFTPHITVKGDRTMQTGEVVQVRVATLVKSVSEQPKMRLKVADISFS